MFSNIADHGPCPGGSASLTIEVLQSNILANGKKRKKRRIHPKASDFLTMLGHVIHSLFNLRRWKEGSFSELNV